MNEVIEDINIENMIYEIRGVEVMLDSDLAKLYHVETKRINEAVKNNPDKFPERYSFVLTNESYDYLRSKFSTLEVGGVGKYTKYHPRVFTEQGVVMLASVLKNKYEKQYNNITFINNNSFHDRFVILDRNKLYVSGSSFKGLGKKCFSINSMSCEYTKDILQMIGGLK